MRPGPSQAAPELGGVAAQRVVAAVGARGRRRHGASAPVGLGAFLHGPTRQHCPEVQATRLATAQKPVGRAAEPPATPTGGGRAGCTRVGVGARGAEGALYHGRYTVGHG